MRPVLAGRRRVAAVAVLLAVAATGVVTASASTLGVTGGTLSTATVTHPCPGVAQASPVASTDWYHPGYAGLEITLPDGCGPAELDVSVLSGATRVAHGAGTVAGTGTVTTDVFADPDVAVAATVDGWALPVEYAFTPPASCHVTAGSGSCDAAVTVWTGQRPGGSSEALYFDVWVTTTSTEWVTWEVTFHLDNPYYGVAVTRLGNSDLDDYRDGNVTFSESSPINDVHRTRSCSTMPDLSVTGDGDGQVNRNNNRNVRNFSLVRDDHARFFSLVVNRPEAGYSDVLAPGC